MDSPENSYSEEKLCNMDISNLMNWDEVEILLAQTGTTAPQCGMSYSILGLLTY